MTLVLGDPNAPFSRANTPKRYSILWIILHLYLVILSIKQGHTKYHFLSLWYDSIWDWTLVSQTIVEHSTHCANIYIYNQFYFKRFILA